MTVSRFGQENYIANGLGIPAHDYISNTYDANDNLTKVEYFIGGSTGRLVAELVLTYDANDNLLTVERTQ